MVIFESLAFLTIFTILIMHDLHYDNQIIDFILV